MRRQLAVIILLITYAVTVMAADGSQVLAINKDLADYSSNARQILLSDNEIKWLSQKQRLVIAVSSPDGPPIEIITHDKVYDGITADILRVVSHQLGIAIEVRQYHDRLDAIKAVLLGNADLIGSSNTFELESGLSLTRPYIIDSPALYTRKSMDAQALENIKRLAIYDGYLPWATITSLFKDAKVTIYPSRHQAMSAVVYNHADAVLIDRLTGNFYINRYYRDDLRFLKEVNTNTQGFSFSLRNDELLLKEVINKVLASVSNDFYIKATRRWSGGGVSVNTPENINLSPAELTWLNENKKIKIAVNRDLPPFSFLDAHGRMQGLAIDFGQIVAARLGIAVEFIPISGSLVDTAPLENNDIQMMFINSNVRSKAFSTNKYVFSKPFIDDPFVFVVNKGRREQRSDLPPRYPVAAIVPGLISNEVAKSDPHVETTRLFSDIDDALECVVDKKCDAAILPLRIAKSFLIPAYEDDLLISGESMLIHTAKVSLATLPSNQVLLNIFNKAITSIPSDELESIANSWVKSVKKRPLKWADIQREYGVYIALALAVVLARLIWSFSLGRQIRQRKKAEQALNTQLEFIETLVDSTPHPIYARDQLGNIVLCNTAYADFLGMEKWELIASPLWESEIRWPYIAPLHRAFHKIQEGEELLAGDYRLQHPTKTVDVYHWLRAYRDSLGNISGVVGGWIDVSERTRLTDELAQATQQAQEASRAKSTFLATMSHEIRTPMNAVIGLLELTLRRGRLHKEDEASLATAHGSAKDLLTLIGDILDISKIESGRLELVPEPHDIVTLTHSVVAVFAALAREKRLRLELFSTGSLWVRVDALRYKQVLSNLISNAIKYTDKGAVEVTLAAQEEGGVCRLQVVVRDTGCGIALEEQATLFQPFRQASQPEQIQQSGTGLGLMISRSLCESMGGALMLESAPGEGTRVVVTLSLPAAEAVVLPLNEDEGTSQSMDRLQVMVVDDHPTNRLLISQQLSYLGHDCIVAESGEQALQLFREASIDVMITDFNMPGMSGLELARRCRAHEQSENGKRCVILGLTADARKEQVDEAHAAGMDDCLFKPVGLEVLARCLRQHVCREGRGEEDQISACTAEMLLVLDKLTGGQPALVKPLLAEFVRASDEDLALMQLKVTEVDLAGFMDAVHRLKGGARIVGASSLVMLCSELEEGDCDLDSARMGLERLLESYRLVRLACLRIQSS
ncbi:TPA: ATP-binding protein [Aeromonas hydrophila]